MKMRSTGKTSFIGMLLIVTFVGVIGKAATTTEGEKYRISGGEVKGTPEEKPRTKRTVNRLPNYFRSVVTEKQRQKIYQIQNDYRPRIQELKEQLERLTEERNAKIDAVLTHEQRKKIARIKKAAKEKRRKAKEAKVASKPKQ